MVMSTGGAAAIVVATFSKVRFVVTRLVRLVRDADGLTVGSL
ncbi:hypothetical protein ACFQ0T_04515 [Kitasatospora gansuensis]